MFRWWHHSKINQTVAIITNMKIDQLISPLDNRYSDEILELSEIFSESNLNKTRFIIEL